MIFLSGVFKPLSGQSVPTMIGSVVEPSLQVVFGRAFLLQLQRGDLETAKVLEPDEPGPTLDALPGQLGGNPEEDRHVRAEGPRFARPLQEANRILHDTFEACSLVCVRRICVSIAQDEFSFL